MSLKTENESNKNQFKITKILTFLENFFSLYKKLRSLHL